MNIFLTYSILMIPQFKIEDPSVKKSYKKNAIKKSRWKKRGNQNRNNNSYLATVLVNYNLPPLSSYMKIHIKNRRGLIKIRQKLFLLQRLPEAMSSLTSVPKILVTQAYLELVTTLEHRIAYKGFVPTMVWLKDVHGQYLRYMSNSIFKMPHNNLDLNGLIKDFPTINLLSSNCSEDGHKYRKLVSSILQIFRLFEPKGDIPSPNSIVEPFPRENVSTDYSYGSFIKSSFYSLKIEERTINFDLLNKSFNISLRNTLKRYKGKEWIDLIRDATRLHVSSRNGPNGPSLPTAPLDFYSIRNEGLLQPIKSWIYMLKSKPLKRLYFLLRYSKFSFSSKSSRFPVSARIGEKTEVGGKVRLFALISYETQSIFSGLHKIIFNNILRRIPEDGTFDHNSAALKARSLTVSVYKSQIHSVDLTTATDRLPVLFQAEVVGQLMGNLEFGKLWKTILVSRDYHYSGKPLKYAVGQPMGALSSWAMLALTHHIIVRACFIYFGESYRGRYLIIGDDVVISSDNASNLYSFLMEKIFCVPISKSKGYSRNLISNNNPLGDYNIHSVVEIAKRVFYNGYEITGISPNLFEDLFVNPGSVPNVVNTLTSKMASEGEQFYLSWDVVNTLSKLSFKPTLTAQLITLLCSEAISFQGKSVSVQELDELGIPWSYDSFMLSRAQEFLNGSLITGMVRLYEEALDKLLKLYSFKLLTLSFRAFNITFPSFKYLIRMATSHLGSDLIEVVRELGTVGVSLNTLPEVTLLLSGLHNIIDLINLLEGSETRRVPQRIMVSQDIRKLCKEALKNKSFSDFLTNSESNIDRYVSGEVNDIQDISESIIEINFNYETGEFESSKLLSSNESNSFESLPEQDEQ